MSKRRTYKRIIRLPDGTELPNTPENMKKAKAALENTRAERESKPSAKKADTKSSG